MGFTIAVALSAGLTTNSVSIPSAPRWLTASRVNKISDRVERVLEWSIRRVQVRWYEQENEFQKAVALPGNTVSVLAVAKRNENAIHIGTRVTSENFDAVFGHELAHIIMFQKYKDAIPKWLEEGLANYAARNGKIDYQYLENQLQKAGSKIDVREMSHPFKETKVEPKFHYFASTALIEMISSKCRIADLLQLAVGQKLESYLGTFCNIKDVNSDFTKWVKRKAGTGTS